MITLDLAGELSAALSEPRVRAAVTALIRPVVAECVRSELDRRVDDVFLDAKSAAKLLGLSLAAFKMRRRRHPALDGMSVGGGRFRRWRRSDLEAFMRNGGEREHA